MSDGISDAVLVATQTIEGIYTQLPAESATAKSALKSALDALGVFERQARLIAWDRRRQIETIERREKAAAAEAAAKAELAAAREEKRHAAVLVSAGEQIAAQKAARDHFAKKGTK